MGMRKSALSQDMDGAGGSGVFIPLGESVGMAVRYGYLRNRISRTGFVKSMKASSMEAFSYFHFSLSTRIIRAIHTDLSIGKMFVEHRKNFQAFSSVMI